MGVQSQWEDTLGRVGERAMTTLKANWHMGVSAFGGPPVHFKIVRKVQIMRALTKIGGLLRITDRANAWGPRMIVSRQVHEEAEMDRRTTGEHTTLMEEEGNLTI